LLVGREVVIERPKHFFRGKDRGGTLPDTVTLRCHIPAELGVNVEEFLAELRTSVEAAERKHALERQAKGMRVLGARTILAQLWWRSPASEDEDMQHRSESRQSRRLVTSFKIKPTLAAKSAWARVEALARNQEFVQHYRRARLAWLDKRPIAFPQGTYWLRRFAGVPIDPIDHA
jgi:putative transposase